MKILGIGNAIVDVICKVKDNYLSDNNLTKGSMKLVYEIEFKKLLSTLEIEETVSGGSVANSIVGLSQLGNEVGFIGKVSDDEMGKKYEEGLIKETLFFSCDNPTIEFATEPPAIVCSIFKLDKIFLNSISSTNFIVLFVRLFFDKKISSTLQITSTIAFPIPKIFILSFLKYKWTFAFRITSSTNFTSQTITFSCFTKLSSIINYL